MQPQSVRLPTFPPSMDPFYPNTAFGDDWINNIDPKILEFDRLGREQEQIARAQHERDRLQSQNSLRGPQPDEDDTLAGAGTHFNYNMTATQQPLQDTGPDLLTGMGSGIVRSCKDDIVELLLTVEQHTSPVVPNPVFDDSPLPYSQAACNRLYFQACLTQHQANQEFPTTPQHPVRRLHDNAFTPPASESRPSLNPEAGIFTPMGQQGHAAAASTHVPRIDIGAAAGMPPTLGGFSTGLATPSSTTSAQLHRLSAAHDTSMVHGHTAGRSVHPPHVNTDEMQQQPFHALGGCNQTPLLLPTANLTFRPAVPETPSRAPKRQRSQPQFHLDGAPEQPIDVDKWAHNNRTSLYHANQHEDEGALLQPGPSKKTKTESIAQSTTSYVCPSEGCGKNFQKRSDMEHHRRIHKPKTYACTLCDGAFHFNKDLKRHMKKHNKSERHLLCTVLGCPYNTKGFQREDHRRRHMQKKHPSPGS